MSENVNRKTVGPLLHGAGLESIMHVCYERGDVESVLNILPNMPCKTVLAICQKRAHITGNDVDGFKVVFDDDEDEGA